MESVELDDVDRGILHMLQKNARDVTASEMAERVSVSSSTVRNRIERLEDSGVIRGYHPELDYEQAQYQLQMVVICRAPVGKRSDFVDAAIDIDGVVTVREMLTGTDNVHVEAVGVDSDAIDRTTERLTDIGLEIQSVNLVKKMHVQPFDHFGNDIVNGDD
ncbi:Lrp/AsnC family transcriptional regulator [Natrarchaeobius chitinivorans]|uniref:Lrp/AsnC family transcriptional regulator n=1 Tax=Natrarchaeobius chitinivorans TaxID=1679083 RepID=A0A3N6M338_NATCH|nr:Lrp/AsnC family transcriptional regulator [Natrarchaeobius chitinivorans]RQG97878.1 Lrp/AsnC family transcriptional regulator [Natrarchaeobius chitinivorans]